YIIYTLDPSTTWMYTLSLHDALPILGGEFGDTKEWNYKSELNWDLLKHSTHAGLQQYVKALNQLYTSEPALYENQFDPNCFEWVDRKSTRLNSSHVKISYAVFCLKKK